MKIQEIQAKTILGKSKLPNSDFVINPYVGCVHGCKYCYAKFMQHFSSHTEEVWGEFVDVKINAPNLIPKKNNYQDKSITIGSVTDPYQSLEKKYQLTRQLLKKILAFQPYLCVMTKSALVIRDIDLFKQFKNCIIAISLGFLDDNIRQKIEPLASSVEERLYALKQLHEAGIKTAHFVAPIFPYLSKWQNIVKTTIPFTNQYWFEDLHIYPSSTSALYKTLASINSNLVNIYRSIYANPKNYWNAERKKIETFCTDHKLDYEICFHEHKKQSF